MKNLCLYPHLWSMVTQLLLLPTLANVAPAQENKPALTGQMPAPIDPADAAILTEKLALARQHSDLAARTLAVAQSLQGTPYGTLSASPNEYLMLSARQLDCWTFVEISLAIALAAQHKEASVATVADYVRQLRYWGGTVDGYASRVHYLSGWLRQAQDLGYLRDITQDLGGQPFRKDIRYMSDHPEQYPPLKDPETLRRIRQVETRLSRRTHYYIPQNHIERIERHLQPGDIIAITSARPGLDFAHLGFAIAQKGRIHLLHASSLQGRVVISAQPLGAYVRSQKGQTGVAVGRINGK
ncbi:MAG: DUF1460 domain-containing protein [Saprospiraceae bacterium]|nr:DUF1460 domain-containing protein [Saprospiraceae bacterium]MDW8229989.1 DUF1460 domain-containing protein [Saprospiraceae bacterium]